MTRLPPEPSPDPPRRNFHTHTFRCHHAVGEVIDYARCAQEQGAEVLGITDHTPLPDGKWPEVRMTLDGMDGYVGAVEAARAAFPDLRLLLGLECDWDPGYAEFYRNEMLGRCGVQYLIAGPHWYPCKGEWLDTGDCTGPECLRAYADHVVGMISSGLFACITHPDAFGSTPTEWTADHRACALDILAAAGELRVPLEINGLGMRKPPVRTPAGERWKYPWAPFWELAAEFDVEVVCNSDAHRPEDVLASIAQGRRFAERYGLRQVDEGFPLRGVAGFCLWVDADACPRGVKEIVFRASARLRIPVRLVSNGPLPVPPSPLVRPVRVTAGPDEADARIIASVQPGDLVITADIPLASEVVRKGATGIDPRGNVYSEQTVGQRLAVRDLLHELRSVHEMAGGPAPFGAADKQRFAAALDRLLAARRPADDQRR